jgi:hypothetical protein
VFLLTSVLSISARPFEKDVPTGNLTEDIDSAINHAEVLPSNGIVIINMEGATDMNINEFPLPGISVTIQSAHIK